MADRAMGLETTTAQITNVVDLAPLPSGNTDMHAAQVRKHRQQRPHDTAIAAPLVSFGLFDAGSEIDHEQVSSRQN